MDKLFWSSKRVLLTGHTGFKGSWMALWLQTLGAEVCGLALMPHTNPSLFVESDIALGMESHIADLRDYSSIERIVNQFKPEIVIHMAAQPLVRYSYEHPVETFATNVMGTVHLLESIRRVGSVKSVVNVTTDKCYENKEWVWAYRENEAVGGHDPYSSSKGCSELVTSAYRRSFFEGAGIGLASARAGNVIGGGDWAQDRLVPDILRAFERGQPVQIRNPSSIRPWQHVLEPLSGYLILAEKLWADSVQFSGAWNFGPREADAKPVSWIADHMVSIWGQGAQWCQDERVDSVHEAHNLRLDISKSIIYLGWKPRWDLAKALQKTIDWQRARGVRKTPKEEMLLQISEYSNTST